MTNHDPDRDDRKLLGVGPDASVDEIRWAFRKMTDLWRSGALATYNLVEPAERVERLAAIEAAYGRLVPAQQRSDGPALEILSSIASPTAEPSEPEPERETDPGGLLRFRRHRMGLSLKEVENRIKVNHRQLEAIEENRKDLLPPSVFVRGFLVAYAQLLKVEDPEAFAKIYLDRWPKDQSPL